MTSPREDALADAARLVTGDRNASYGSPTQNFQNTASLWTVQFRHKLRDGEEFTAADVARAMIHLKLARMVAGDKDDNWIDILGYGACGFECDVEAADPVATQPGGPVAWRGHVAQKLYWTEGEDDVASP